MGIFTTLGYAITSTPWLCSVLMPVTSILFVSIGFQSSKVEDSVQNIWIPESTPYSKNQAYSWEILGRSSSSNFLIISKPRSGGNALTAPLLLELQQLLNDSETTTKVTVHDATYSFQDVCSNPAGAYVFPCLRMTVLDCYAEGGYGFSETAAIAWRGLTLQSFAETSRPRAIVERIQQIVSNLYTPIVTTGLASSPTGPCASSCVVNGPAPLVAAAFGVDAGTWEADPVCDACLNTTLPQMADVMRDIMYEQALGQIAQQVGVSNHSGLEADKEAQDAFLFGLLQGSPTAMEMIADHVDAMLEAQVNFVLAGQTPYTFKTFAPVGGRRLDLRDASTGRLASDSSVLAAASSTCYSWDGGVALPANLDVLLYGRPSPDIFSVDRHLTSVEALQHLYSFLVPEDLQSRLANRPMAHGGPLTVSLEQAEDVLAAFKNAFVEKTSAGWDDASSGKLENTAFADDQGSAGTFQSMLNKMTTKSLPLIAIYGGVTVVLSALFFASRDLVASRVGLVMIGSIFALLGCFASLGLSALLGINLNVVHFWIIPFIIVGIGIDDMYMLALSAKLVESDNGCESFVQAYSKVAVPITMTSLVNAAMFMIMSFVSDVRAIYQAGFTGLIATFLLYFTMVLSFSALVFLDGRRRAEGRYDCLPCRKNPLQEERAPADVTDFTGITDATLFRLDRPPKNDINLEFAKLAGTIFPSSTVQLSNETGSYFAFKVQTTAARSYLVQPSFGVVCPNEATQIDFLMDGQGQTPMDKFQVLAMQVQDDSPIQKEAEEWQAKQEGALWVQLLGVNMEIKEPGADPTDKETSANGGSPELSSFVYDYVYRPTVITVRGRIMTLVLAAVILAVAVSNLREIPVGLDLDDFFPQASMSGQYSVNKKEYFPSWPVRLNWGQLNYKDPDVQLKMAHQWEQVLSSSYIASSGLSTSMVWTAALAEWGVSTEDAKCMSTFRENTIGLKLKSEGGICLPIDAANGASRCPVFEVSSDDELAYCLSKWKQSSRQFDVIGPMISMTSDGLSPKMPIQYSAASGSILFAHRLHTTTDYTNMIKETRKYMDDDTTIHAWMSGIPFDFWEQYLTIIDDTLMIAGLSLSAGFVISFVFIFTELSVDGHAIRIKQFYDSLLAALMIAIISGASFVTVVGFCALANIKLSGFTSMSCLMSTSLAVEYSVHILHHFLAAGSAEDRIERAVKWLFAPSAMAFLSSAVSILMMAFSEFNFIRLYFFAPLACAVLASYFFGSFVLPCLLGSMFCKSQNRVGSGTQTVDTEMIDTQTIDTQTISAVDWVISPEVFPRQPPHRTQPMFAAQFCDPRP